MTTPHFSVPPYTQNDSIRSVLLSLVGDQQQSLMIRSVTQRYGFWRQQARVGAAHVRRGLRIMERFIVISGTMRSYGKIIKRRKGGGAETLDSM